MRVGAKRQGQGEQKRSAIHGVPYGGTGRPTRSHVEPATGLDTAGNLYGCDQREAVGNMTGLSSSARLRRAAAAPVGLPPRCSARYRSAINFQASWDRRALGINPARPHRREAGFIDLIQSSIRAGPGPARSATASTGRDRTVPFSMFPSERPDHLKRHRLVPAERRSRFSVFDLQSLSGQPERRRHGTAR